MHRPVGAGQWHRRPSLWQGARGRPGWGAAGGSMIPASVLGMRAHVRVCMCAVHADTPRLLPQVHGHVRAWRARQVLECREMGAETGGVGGGEGIRGSAPGRQG